MMGDQPGETRRPLRIAYVCKRKKSPKDMVNDRYGRLYQIPYQLAELGHEVQAYCLSYHGQSPGSWRHETVNETGTLDWKASILAIRNLDYPWQLLRRIRRMNPDVLIAASDMPHIILGNWLAKRLGCRFVADLYDDYESFGQARIPGVTQLFRNAVRRADLVTTVSAPLADKVMQTYQPHGEVLNLPNSIDGELFHPMDPTDCRHQLGLPENADLIGTAGDLKASRGIGMLYSGWQQLVSDNPNCHLVLAGPIDNTCPPPDDERVHYLGQLPNSQIPVLFNALDVGVIYLANDSFGQHCNPQKAQEMMACGLPIVAADVGAMPELMTDAKHALYRSDDHMELARAVKAKLQARQPIHGAVKTWADSIAVLASRLETI